MTGIVTGFEIAKNRNGANSVVLLQVRISDQNDIQTVELMTPPGDDSIPPIGSRVKIFDAGQAWKIAIADQDSITPTVDAGEKKIYSQSGGSEAAYIYLRSDGVAEVNGNAKSAVSFQDLATAINSLISSIDAAIAGAITGHTHVYAPGPSPPVPTAPGVGAAPSVVGDISAAEVQEVLLP